MSVINRLDEIEENIMSELKDFQKATVERIDYLYRHGQKRILVSDEVGLGKTLIARGTIAKFAKIRKEEEDDLVKVVYICSNATIAQQNLDKLRIINELKVEDSNTSRLSMQHLNIFNDENDEKVKNNYIQLIPLTPQTSFKITNSQGLAEERALIYTILKHLPKLREYNSSLSEFLRFGVNDWDYLTMVYDVKVDSCNRKSDGEYLHYMVHELSTRLENYKVNGKKFITELRRYCRKAKFSNRESKFLIIELRKIFTEISLEKLDPDIIIMDEFQRFKYLLNSDINSDIGLITNKFFNSEDLRILMLSATPYKMYSTLDEIDDTQVDEHYKEFFDVINFLNISKINRDKFFDVWSNYSIELKEFTEDTDSLICAKNAAENLLYRNICRTERIAELNAGDMIDDSDKNNLLKVFKEDILSYIEIEEFLDSIGLNTNIPIDYVKSSPYLMSFMKNYKLKRNIENYFRKNPHEISKIDKNSFWIKKSEINNYKKINFHHARLNQLMENVLKDNAELLLWIPPSKEYYPSEGVFKDTNNFSKTLIFSSWEMVPRMISSLVSYEVERKTIGKLSKKDSDIKYFKMNNYTSPRIKYSLNKGKPSQMTLLSLIYPSSFLAMVYVPIECLNDHLSLEEIENLLKVRIKSKLDKFKEEQSLREDYRWYYLAPLLLDCEDERLKNRGSINLESDLEWYDCTDYVDNWFKKFKRLLKDEKDRKGFETHINYLNKTFKSLVHQFKEDNEDTGSFENLETIVPKLGRKPADLLDVLVDLAIASPANCIYRSYRRELSSYGNLDLTIRSRGNLEDYYSNESLKNLLAKEMKKYVHLCSKLAFNFLYLMNTQEAMATIDYIYSKSEDAYWKNILTYSKEGNLQAVFDEYVHLLSNGLDKKNENRINIIHERFLGSMGLKTTPYDVDTFKNFKSRVIHNKNKSMNIRTHFAVSFTKGAGNAIDTNRKTSVRDAFNSPFRPFVLASTSIGQEGLDFHNYCRRIVHWNLPSNPIDLEQREGRVNRFACLAIRQNIAKRYGDMEFKNNIWIEMFREASIEEKVNGASDLIPFWGLSERDDMIKIERILPLYPFSRDEARYDRLIKILAIYRLTLGQARQEELLESVFLDKDLDNLEELFINLSPYYKKDVEDLGDNDIVVEDLGEKNSIVEDINDDNYISYSQEDLRDDEDMDIKLKYCFNCGEKLVIKGAKFCYNCGQDLRVENLDLEEPLVLKELNEKFILPIKSEIWEGNIWDYEQANELTVNVNDISDVRDYWQNVKDKLIENNLFEGHFIKLNEHIYWMPIDDLPLNLTRIEMLIHNGFIEVKIYIAWCGILYDFLKDKLNSIENDLGFKLGWVDGSQARQIVIYNLIDMNNKDLWEDAMNWHISVAKRFYDVFSPLMKEFLLENPDVLDFDDIRANYWKELDYRLDKSNLLTMDVHHQWAGYPFILNNFSWGEVRFILNAYKNKYRFRICLACNKSIYNFLHRQKREIEEELGFNLVWEKRKWFSDIYITHRGNVKNKDDWEDALNWQVSNAEKFKKVFIPRINEFYNR